jgi:hypothetical protein
MPVQRLSARYRQRPQLHLRVRAQRSREVREIERTADSGAVKRKGFCPNCGSPIYNKPDEKPEFIGIYVGTLDDASTFKPSVVLFCSRGYAWDHLDPEIPKLPEWHPGSR